MTLEEQIAAQETLVANLSKQLSAAQAPNPFSEMDDPTATVKLSRLLLPLDKGLSDRYAAMAESMRTKAESRADTAADKAAERTQQTALKTQELAGEKERKQMELDADKLKYTAGSDQYVDALIKRLNQMPTDLSLKMQTPGISETDKNSLIKTNNEEVANLRKEILKYPRGRVFLGQDEEVTPPVVKTEPTSPTPKGLDQLGEGGADEAAKISKLLDSGIITQEQAATLAYALMGKAQLPPAAPAAPAAKEPPPSKAEEEVTTYNKWVAAIAALPSDRTKENLGAVQAAQTQMNTELANKGTLVSPDQKKDLADKFSAKIKAVTPKAQKVEDKETFTAFKDGTKALIVPVSAAYNLGNAVYPALKHAIDAKEPFLDESTSQKLAALVYQTYNPGTLVAGEMSSAVNAAKGADFTDKVITWFKSKYGAYNNQLPIRNAVRAFNDGITAGANAFKDYQGAIATYKEKNSYDKIPLLDSFNSGIINPARFLIQGVDGGSDNQGPKEGDKKEVYGVKMVFRKGKWVAE